MKEFRRSSQSATDSAAGLQVLIVSVWWYRGNVVNPMWSDVDTGETFHNLFGVLLLPGSSEQRKQYYSIFLSFNSQQRRQLIRYPSATGGLR